MNQYPTAYRLLVTGVKPIQAPAQQPPQPAQQWETYQQTSLETTPAEERHANDDNECSPPVGCWFRCLLKDVRVCTQTESNHLRGVLNSAIFAYHGIMVT